MFCKYCGCKIFKTDKFCYNCGNSLANEKNNSKIDVQLLKDFLRLYDESNKSDFLYLYDKNKVINNKYLNVVKLKYLIYTEEIYLIIDFSMFGNAKQGIVLTDSGMICKNGEILRKYNWNEICKLDIRNENGTLYMGRLVFVTYSRYAEIVCHFFKCLKEMLDSEVQSWR